MFWVAMLLADLHYSALISLKLEAIKGFVNFTTRVVYFEHSNTKLNLQQIHGPSFPFKFIFWNTKPLT